MIKYILLIFLITLTVFSHQLRILNAKKGNVKTNQVEENNQNYLMARLEFRAKIADCFCEKFDFDKSVNIIFGYHFWEVEYKEGEYKIERKARKKFPYLGFRMDTIYILKIADPSLSQEIYLKFLSILVENVKDENTFRSYSLEAIEKYETTDKIREILNTKYYNKKLAYFTHNNNYHFFYEKPSNTILKIKNIGLISELSKYEKFIFDTDSSFYYVNKDYVSKRNLLVNNNSSSNKQIKSSNTKITTFGNIKFTRQGEKFIFIEYDKFLYNTSSYPAFPYPGVNLDNSSFYPNPNLTKEEILKALDNSSKAIYYLKEDSLVITKN